jgi:hypothetical protein
MKAKMNAKLALRISILMVGLVGTFIAAAVQQVPAQDGGPLWLCPPRTTCQPTQYNPTVTRPQGH